MKKILTTVMAALCIATNSFAQNIAEAPFVVPSLHNWKATAGEAFTLTNGATISIGNQELTTAGELLQEALKANKVEVSITGDKKGTIRLEMVKNKKLGNEGYRLVITKNGVTVQAQTAQGVVWGVQTISQMMESGGTSLPLGSSIDVPEYALRGFMIDCGRKNIPMDYLRRLVKCMSHYKMNTLQVHLNDNGFRKYFHDNWDETYAAFRLESNLFPDLTARDGYYTKDEFRAFTKWAATMGVEIIPEIDAPAHALAFTHYRPQYANPAFGIDHLDLSNKDVIPFLDSLYSEYLEGPDPVFCGPRVHIGTDEYNNSTEEARESFRAFTQHYIELVKKAGKQPVLWGSLTWSKGKTPIDVDGVLMDVWSNDFAQPDSMKQLGYQLVSIPDGWVYIVPAAGYYYDYLNQQFLYEKWTPANINGKQFEEHDPQIEGGMFAVWNDVCGNGISTYDIHHRTMPGMQVIAQKAWSATNTVAPYDEWAKQLPALQDEIGYTWGRLSVDEAIALGNIAPGAPLRFIPIDGTTADAFSIDDLGYNGSVSFDIEAADEPRGTILFRSDFAEFYITDPVTGRLGFIRDGYAFNFDYKLRVGERHNIRIDVDNKATTLYVDGKMQQKLGPDVTLAADKKPYNVMRTLAFPLTETGKFKSRITNLKIKKN